MTDIADDIEALQKELKNSPDKEVNLGMNLNMDLRQKRNRYKIEKQDNSL